MTDLKLSRRALLGSAGAGLLTTIGGTGGTTSSRSVGLTAG